MSMTSIGMTYRGYGLILKISKKVFKVWNDMRQVNIADKEKFGVIIGYRLVSSKEYWLNTVTIPAPHDHATQSSFLLQDKNHQRIVDLFFQNSNGTLTYLGTWHTHPEPVPTPSSIDKRDWINCIKRNPGRQLFFVIIGIKEIHVYIKRKWCFGFKQLKQEK